MDAATLPDLDQLDSQALKSLILAQHEQVLAQREQLASRDVEIEHLKLLIAKTTPHAVRLGRRRSLGKSNRTTGTAGGRARGAAKNRNNCNSRVNGKCYRGAPCAAAIARSLATGSAKVSSEARSLSGLWRKAEARLGEDISEESWNTCRPVSKVIQYVRPQRLACAGCDRIDAGGSPEPGPSIAVLQVPGLLAHAMLVSKYG